MQHHSSSIGTTLRTKQSHTMGLRRTISGREFGLGRENSNYKSSPSSPHAYRGTRHVALIAIAVLALVAAYNNLVTPEEATVTSLHHKQRTFRTEKVELKEHVAVAAGDSADYNVDDYLAEVQEKKQKEAQVDAGSHGGRGAGFNEDPDPIGSCLKLPVFTSAVELIERTYSEIMLRWIQLGAKDVSLVFEQQWDISDAAASELRGRLRASILRGGDFVFAFMGGRATKAAEVKSSQRFTSVFFDKLRPVFQIFGVNLRVRNDQRGPAVSSFPYGWCLAPLLGNDVDVLAWEYGLISTGADESKVDIEEAFVRQAYGISPVRPMVLMVHLEFPSTWANANAGVKRVKDSLIRLEELGVHHVTPGNGLHAKRTAAQKQRLKDSPLSSVEFWTGDKVPPSAGGRRSVDDRITNSKLQSKPRSESKLKVKNSGDVSPGESTHSSAFTQVESEFRAATAATDVATTGSRGRSTSTTSTTSETAQGQASSTTSDSTSSSESRTNGDSSSATTDDGDDGDDAAAASSSSSSSSSSASFGARGHEFIGDSLALLYLRQMHIAIQGLCERMQESSRATQSDLLNNERITHLSRLFEAHVATAPNGGVEKVVAVEEEDLPKPSAGCGLTCQQQASGCALFLPDAPQGTVMAKVHSTGAASAATVTVPPIPAPPHPLNEDDSQRDGATVTTDDTGVAGDSGDGSGDDDDTSPHVSARSDAGDTYVGADADANPDDEEERDDVNSAMKTHRGNLRSSSSSSEKRHKKVAKQSASSERFTNDGQPKQQQLDDKEEQEKNRERAFSQSAAAAEQEELEQQQAAVAGVSRSAQVRQSKSSRAKHRNSNVRTATGVNADNGDVFANSMDDDDDDHEDGGLHERRLAAFGNSEGQSDTGVDDVDFDAAAQQGDVDAGIVVEGAAVATEADVEAVGEVVGGGHEVVANALGEEDEKVEAVSPTSGESADGDTTTSSTNNNHEPTQEQSEPEGVWLEHKQPMKVVIANEYVTATTSSGQSVAAQWKYEVSTHPGASVPGAWVGTSLSGNLTVRIPAAQLHSYVILCQDPALPTADDDGGGSGGGWNTRDVYGDGSLFSRGRVHLAMNATLNGMTVNLARDTLADLRGNKQVTMFGANLLDSAASCALFTVTWSHLAMRARHAEFHEIKLRVIEQDVFVGLSAVVWF